MKHIEVELQGGGSVIAQISAGENGFETGQTVYVWWNPSDELGSCS